MTSTAILATPYAVLQPDSLDVPGSKPPDEEREFDGSANSLGFLALERARMISLFMNSIGDIDVGVGGGLFVGVADDEGFLRK